MHTLALILTGLASFTLFLCVHILLWRSIHGEKGITLLAQLSLGSILLMTVIADVWFNVRWQDVLVVSLPLHAFLTLAYFHLYVGTYRSLSVRILNELAQAG